MTDLAKVIDYTLLKPAITADEIKRFCRRARHYGVYSICVAPVWVKDCVRYLKRTNILVGTVAGFPLGNQTTVVKLSEIKQVIKDGAKEIDVVFNIGYLKSGRYREVEQEVRKIVSLTHRSKVLIKLILETCYLTRQEIVKACRMALEAKVDFVKTSTGFGPMGAQEKDISLMKKVVGERMGIKAAGGIRTRLAVLKFLRLGATRIGVSVLEKILG